MFVERKINWMKLYPIDWDQMAQEIDNCIKKSDLKPSNNDMTQLLQSTFIQAQCYDFYQETVDSKTNNYVIKQEHSFIQQKIENLQKFRFRTKFTNNGACKLTVCNMTKDILNIHGSQLMADEIIAEKLIEVRYYSNIGGRDAFVLVKRLDGSEVALTTGMWKFTSVKEREDGFVILGETIGDIQSKADYKDNKNYALFKMVWKQYTKEPIWDVNGNPTNRTDVENDWNLHKCIRTFDSNGKAIGIATTGIGEAIGSVGTSEGSWETPISQANMPVHRHNNNIVRMMWDLYMKVVTNIGVWITWGRMGHIKKAGDNSLLSTITRPETFTAGLSGRGDAPYNFNVAQSSLKSFVLIKQ